MIFVCLCSLSLTTHMKEHKGQQLMIKDRIKIIYNPTKVNKLTITHHFLSVSYDFFTSLLVTY